METPTVVPTVSFSGEASFFCHQLQDFRFAARSPELGYDVFRRRLLRVDPVRGVLSFPNLQVGVFGRIRDIFCHYFFENVSRPASLSSPPGTQGMMLGLPW